MALLVLCTSAEGAHSEWVYPGPDGRLVYKTTERGDRIMDFSHAGYMGGGVALPDVPVKMTVKPVDGDNTAAIQEAIDKVSAMPLEKGLRGAVLLAPGVYTCLRTVTISASGVVLRGSGAQGQTRSTLKLAGQPHLGLAIRSPGGGRGQRRGGGVAETADTAPSDGFKAFETSIADTYVPSGVMTCTVADATGLVAGDTISIRRPVTRAWVESMQMHDLVRDGRPQTWIAIGRTVDTERRIAAVAGNRITLDVPLADSYDSKFLNPPGTAVVKIRPPARVMQCGVEHLHIESPPQPISHSQPHYTALRINGEDCWARDVWIDETMNSVAVGGRRITLQRVCVNRKALHQGSSRPAEFAPNGSQVLLDRCSVHADNIWFVATGGSLPGPVVVLNADFQGQSRAESHQRWATGMLYDNVRAPNGGIEFRNRGSMGSGHGWSMGWGVAWNCTAESYIIQSAPGAPNWIIGCIGESRLSPRPFGQGPNLPEGIKDSHGTPVAPQSLYLAQLAERLGPQAVKNIGYSISDL